MALVKRLNLQKSYEQNTLWKELFQINFADVQFWEKELSNFALFLQQEINSFIETPASWGKSYFKFKKIVSIVKYMLNYFEHYEKIHIHKTNKPKILLEDVSNTLNGVHHDLMTNSKIVTKFKELANLNLKENQLKIVQSWMTSFFQANQSQYVKKTYNKLSNNLQSHISEFLDNNAEIQKNPNYSIFISQEKSNLIDGLSTQTLNEGLKHAKELSLKGWLFYMDEYTALKLIREANNRRFRQKVYQKYQKINRYGQFTFENGEILKKILREKHKIANLMGKSNYAELVLSKYIVNTPSKASSYLNDIELQLMPTIQKIETEILAFAKEDKVKDIKAWDVPYYFQKINKINTKHNQEPTNYYDKYFVFEDFLPKLLKFFEKQFNLSIEKIDLQQIGSNDHFAYKIQDKQSKRHGVFILSPWNNPSKQLCYQIDLLKGDTFDNQFVCPNVQYIQLQINKDKANNSTMTFWDVVTTVHEFGHAFHSFFEQTNDHIHKNLQFSWDLIELPSQFLEHLVYDYQFMRNLSKHCETGKKISKKEFVDLIQSQQYLDSYYIYCNLQKYKAQLWIHQDFQPFSSKNLQEMIESKLSKQGIVYNIAQDEYMTYSDYNLDYGPSGYIYLYSAQLAFQLFSKTDKSKLRHIYMNVFNSRTQKKLKSHLQKHLSFNEVNIDSFIKKNLPIKLYS